MVFFSIFCCLVGWIWVFVVVVGGLGDLFFSLRKLSRILIFFFQKVVNNFRGYRLFLWRDKVFIVTIKHALIWLACNTVACNSTFKMHNILTFENVANYIS